MLIYKCNIFGEKNWIFSWFWLLLLRSRIHIKIISTDPDPDPAQPCFKYMYIKFIVHPICSVHHFFTNTYWDNDPRRVPHFATKYRNVGLQITLRLILFSMMSAFTGFFFFSKLMGSGRASSLNTVKTRQLHIFLFQPKYYIYCNYCNYLGLYCSLVMSFSKDCLFFI